MARLAAVVVNLISPACNVTTHNTRLCPLVLAIKLLALFRVVSCSSNCSLGASNLNGQLFSASSNGPKLILESLNLWTVLCENAHVQYARKFVAPLFRL